ncbi:hypothetical protein MF271_19400 (plasmid) [Deinococcus sp. KNUC1210]|uniref:hypothetical protein n=1 Tax=Deinococcus sp. KNUC1210 TaxID=2917691 RepID=UPI001EF128D1|nr:hypothetical protein [Deinococcus sp. KNUC1210]ULH17358.1 hypothetical protein MF271_19400 [Deinococcus sp. KNUC1210]
MKFNNVEYASQDENALTFTLVAGAVQGDAVTLTGNGTAGRGADGDPFYGKLNLPEGDGKGAVSRDGIVIVKYTGALTAGYRQVTVDGAGKVKPAAATGRACWVIGVDGTYAAIDLG